MEKGRSAFKILTGKPIGKAIELVSYSIIIIIIIIIITKSTIEIKISYNFKHVLF